MRTSGTSTRTGASSTHHGVPTSSRGSPQPVEGSEGIIEGRRAWPFGHSQGSSWHGLHGEGLHGPGLMACFVFSKRADDAARMHTQAKCHSNQMPLGLRFNCVLYLEPPPHGAWPPLHVRQAPLRQGQRRSPNAPQHQASPSRGVPLHSPHSSA